MDDLETSMDDLQSNVVYLPGTFERLEGGRFDLELTEIDYEVIEILTANNPEIEVGEWRRHGQTWRDRIQAWWWRYR